MTDSAYELASNAEDKAYENANRIAELERESSLVDVGGDDEANPDRNLQRIRELQNSQARAQKRLGIIEDRLGI